MTTDFYKPVLLSTKDMMRILGKKSTATGNLRRAIRKHFQRPAYADITLEQFVSFTGLTHNEIYNRLNPG